MNHKLVILFYIIFFSSSCLKAEQIDLNKLNFVREENDLPPLNGTDQEMIATLQEECSMNIIYSCNVVKIINKILLDRYQQQNMDRRLQQQSNFDAQNHFENLDDSNEAQREFENTPEFKQFQNDFNNAMKNPSIINKQERKPVLGGPYTYGCEAMGLHGECTTNDRLEKEIERRTPKY